MPTPSSALAARVGTRLRALREAAGLTQEQVADRAGYTGKYVSEVERGLRDLPLSTLERIVERGLGGAVDELFGAGANSTCEAPAPTWSVEVTTDLERQPERTRRKVLAIVRSLTALAQPARE